jgi:holo-[acyl-carrier protein] synthase
MAGGIGVDIVNIGRLRAFVDRRGDAAIDRLLTDIERIAVRGKRGVNWSAFAGRIAAKEATKKLLGSRGELARWSQIEVCHGLYGEPYLRLSGETLHAARRQGFNGLLVSISHEKDTAIAVVVGTSAWLPWETPWTSVTYSSRSSAS